LREAGFEFLRHGKGSHDIWRNPMTGKIRRHPSEGAITPFR
jgi:predicted RNA binding protein YcfA (HicA-like mRNA interferase family)